MKTIIVFSDIALTMFDDAMMKVCDPEQEKQRQDWWQQLNDDEDYIEGECNEL